MSHFFNTFRSNKPLRTAGVETLLSTSSNYQTFHGKRDKLKNILFEKFTKKYGLSSEHKFILDEINDFVKGNNLNDKDLKLFDQKINRLLKDKGLITNVSKSVDNTESRLNQLKTSYADERKEEIKAEERKEDFNNTKMSGASQLSTLFPNINKSKISQKLNDPEVPEEELIRPKKKPHRFEFEHEEDMWNAFNNVNRRLYEQEKIEEKVKDKEIKRRTKEDLDNQIKHKMLRLEEEKRKNSEYHSILIKHLDHLNCLEEEKQAKIKNKILKEKENRDKQMWDQNYRRKVEKIKLRKYENQLLSYIDNETKAEKENQIKKKIEANEALKKTLEENARNRQRKEELAAQEREENIKSIEEYNKILEKQENDRVLYFKNIEMKSTDFMAKMTDTVLKDLKEKNNQAEQRMNDFLKKKEEKAIQEDKDKIERAKHEKRMMKSYLDMQIEEKKKINEFEKELDHEQAQIKIKDQQMYEDFKREEAEKVSLINNKIKN